MPLRLSLIVACLILGAAFVHADEKKRIHSFERMQLSDVFTCEGATYGDVSGDGVADIIAGPYWYQGPEFKVRHEIYPPKTYDVKGYSDNFFPFLYDFNGDKALDLLLIGFPGEDASWFQNPGAKGGPWQRHLVFRPVDNESPTFVDLDRDGRPELVCPSGGRYGYAVFDPKDPAKTWTFVPIGEKRDVQKFTHGMGVGDVNGDGRLDILEKAGWYEQPASLEGKPLWTYHEQPFAPGVGGAQMYAYDLNGDGLNDVITSLNAHGWGLVWHEQVRDGGKIGFREHKILGKEPSENPYGVAFAQLHAIDLVDMDGDGLKDIVTGKRVWAHYGEPSADPPGVSYWFQLRRKEGGEVDLVPHRIDDVAGVGVQVVAGDVDGDGLPDVVVGNKQGAFFLRHRVREVSEAEWRRAQPRLLANAGLEPAEAAEVMTAPDGFRVDLVAGEPDLHQPVAFTFDDRGRIWVAEAHTYPIRVRGKEGRWDEGQDKIVIFADEDSDGRFETRKVFAEGLNLVSGLEVGYGGVWVGAAPYLLFLADKNGDDHPDGPAEIVLDGFGLEDTHETLNAFNWGPDGWLYGCHGVFTHSRVGKPGAKDADRVPLNAGVWRFHPTRREFEVFAWGTSNPWGVDFNDLGQAFVTACVIPHLYHVIQGARYERQAGRHFDPFHYWELTTIADHRHYAGDISEHAWWGREPVTPTATLEAGGGHAHCGAMIYLADAFPAEYRDSLFMCNIHGNRVNRDILERRGSGYVGHHGKDFLLANDRWFRGINLKYGPEGAVYLIDWYDKNACHRAQPEIWDRTSGRLYRVSYGAPRPITAVNLAAKSSTEVAELTLHSNEWYVRHGRKILAERAAAHELEPTARGRLVEIFRSSERPEKKLRALWALHAARALDEKLLVEALASPHEHVRAWALQLSGDRRAVPPGILARAAAMAREDASPVVRLYLASLLQRLEPAQRWEIAQGLASHAEDAGDQNLPFLDWFGIEPLVAAQPERALALASASKLELLRRSIIRRAASRVNDLEPLLSYLGHLPSSAERVMALDETLRALEGHATVKLPAGWEGVYEILSKDADRAVRDRADAVGVKFGDRRVFPSLRKVLADSRAPRAERERALSILIDGRDADALPVILGLLDDPSLRARALKASAGFDDARVAPAILERYRMLPAEEKVDALATLAARRSSARLLLEAVRKESIPRTDLGAIVIRQLRGLKDPELDAAITDVWGTARETSEERRAEVTRWKATLTPERIAKADPREGRAIFTRTCQGCHTLFGAGGKVAPDITGSNRADLVYILENILDPNAVVGKDYLVTEFTLAGGRFVTGLVTGETESAYTVRTVNEEVLVVKKEVESHSRSELSLMPEGLLVNLKEDEVCDLIAYLASPAQVLLPGTAVKMDLATKRVAAPAGAAVIEGESLKVIRATDGSAASQDMARFGAGLWSADRHLWWTGGKPGSHLELRVNVAAKGTYAVEAAMTQAPDYGIVKLSLDGQAMGSSFDLYHSRVVPTGPTLLGEATLEAGDHTLEVEIVGANPHAAPAYMFGVDYLLLVKKS